MKLRMKTLISYAHIVWNFAVVFYHIFRQPMFNNVWNVSIKCDA